MGRRTWLKLWTESWLRGTLREETASVRGIFADVLALAGDSAYGDDGIIKLGRNAGLTDMQIAEILNIASEEWLHAKKRLVETKRISVDSHNCILVANWRKYQSEYRRQKQYRQNNPKYHSKLRKVTQGSYTEKEIEKKKEKETEKKNAHFDNKARGITDKDKPIRRGKPRHVSEFTPAILGKIAPKYRDLVAKKLGFITTDASRNAKELADVYDQQNNSDGAND